jgi:hypothetical protein
MMLVIDEPSGETSTFYNLNIRSLFVTRELDFKLRIESNLGEVDALLILSKNETLELLDCICDALRAGDE